MVLNIIFWTSNTIQNLTLHHECSRRQKDAQHIPAFTFLNMYLRPRVCLLPSCLEPAVNGCDWQRAAPQSDVCCYLLTPAQGCSFQRWRAAMCCMGDSSPTHSSLKPRFELLAVDEEFCRQKLDIGRAILCEFPRTRPNSGAIADGTFSNEEFLKLSMHMAPQYTGLQTLGCALCHISYVYTHFKTSRVFFSPDLMLPARILR